MRAIPREKELGPMGYETHWKTTSPKYAVSKGWKGEHQYLQTSKISFSPFQYSIFIGLSIALNLFSVHDSGATVYTCLDRLGQTIFTDSPAQLNNCKVFSFPPSTPNSEKEGAQETFSIEQVQTKNFEPVSAAIPSPLDLTRAAESESMPTPPALHDHQAPPSTPFSDLAPGEIPLGIAELLESGNMPPPDIFNEGNLPPGLPFNNGGSPYVESQRNMPETEIQQPGFFIPPDVEAPKLSEIPDSIISHLSAGPGRE